VLPPLSLTGPLLTIRKFSKTRWDLDDLVAIKSLPQPAREFLDVAIHAELNILVSGGTGTGKTTLLNACHPASPGTSGSSRSRMRLSCGSIRITCCASRRVQEHRRSG